jgi:uncharacterized membrane protein
MRQTMVLATAALGGLLAASPATQAGVVYTFAEISPPGQAFSSSVNYGLNNLGQVVGAYETSAAVHGYIYTGGKYVTFDAPGASDTFLNGINDFGQIVGTEVFGAPGQGTSEVFLDNHGKFTNIANSNDFVAIGINDRGQILGFNPNTGAGIVETHGVLTPLPNVTGAAFTSYNGFNNLGQFVGIYFEGGQFAFVETKGVFTVINDPAAGPGGFTDAQGINDFGQIVGQYCDSSRNCHGFLDTNNHFINIDDPNASPGSTFPLLINDVDQILGAYADSAGNFPSFLATDPPGAPEASTWVMMLMGFAGLGLATYGRRRGKRHDNGSALCYFSTHERSGDPCQAA